MLDKWRLNRSASHPFIPLPHLRSSALQTVLSTFKIDIPASLHDWGYPLLVDGGYDQSGQDEGSVRLLAYFTPNISDIPTRGTVILLHGWEGTSHANYNLVTMRELVSAGYHVFRLNLRDHGPGLHVHPQALNPGIFFGTLLSEVVTAISHCADLVQPLPVYLVGFSMGGNFALRTAIRHAETPISNLTKVIAVNPAINPLWTTKKIDKVPAFRRHFRQPWLQQLMAKQRFFPARYDFTPLRRISSLVNMTEWLVDYFGVYQDAEDYFNHYSVLGDATRHLSTPTQIIASLDDMIVSVADIYGLAPGPNMKVDIHPYGGHVGYMHGCPLRHHCGQLVLEALESQ